MKFVWALLFCIFSEASLLSGYNTSNYVGRIQSKYGSPLAIGDWLGRSNALPEPFTENKATFGVPGSVIDLFFSVYELNNASDCAGAYAAIGFSNQTIKDYGDAYSNGDQFFTYVLIPNDSVIAAPSLWDNVFHLVETVYGPWHPQPSFNLTDVLAGYLPTFEMWADQVRAYNDPFPKLTAPDLGVSYSDLITPTKGPLFITTATFFNLTNPSDVATRAWLTVKFGLFPEFMGDGYTLQANHSAQGLAEVILNNRQIQSGDVLIPLVCSGSGFLGLPGYMSAVVRVYDEFDMYADGVLVFSSSSGFGEDVVNLNKSTNLIGIHGKRSAGDGGGAILATIAQKAVSNASWYCHAGFDVSWTKFGYNFLTWPAAVTRPPLNIPDSDLILHNPLAQFIWTNGTDREVYCVIALKTYIPDPTSAVSSASALSLFSLLPILFFF